MQPKILRLPEVIKRTGTSRSSIYRLIEQGEFPKSYPIFGRAVGWSETDINQWIESKFQNESTNQNNGGADHA